MASSHYEFLLFLWSCANEKSPVSLKLGFEEVVQIASSDELLPSPKALKDVCIKETPRDLKATLEESRSRRR